MAGSVRVTDVIRADAIVVGSGAAGLATALHAAGASVILLTEADVGDGSASAAALGGIAAAVADTDSPLTHAADTLAVGGQANDPVVVDLLTTAGPATVDWLDALGTRFERDDAGWRLGREAGHSRDRILHANGDGTGWEITRALAAAVASAPHVTALAGTRVLALLVDRGTVVGVLARRDAPHAAAEPGSAQTLEPHAAAEPGSAQALDLHAAAEPGPAQALEPHAAAEPGSAQALDRADRPERRPDLIAVVAGAVVLATGGCAGAWRRTTNPRGSRGSGLVLAADAGARLADLQYVQFHPTALDCDADPLPLLSEALRGAGATVVDARGRRFLDAVHHDAELAPRDVVARAVWERQLSGERVLLDLRRIDDLERRFPSAVAACRRHGLEPTVAPVPITPAAHYSMGGIAVDRDGRTTLPGLYACGETACTGAHGANRLASNSLLEALVFGERVGRVVRSGSRPSDGAVARAVAALDPTLLVDPARDAVGRVRDLLTTHVGVLRTAPALRAAVDELGLLAWPDAAGPVAVMGRMVAAAALAHRERRGAHWRTDTDRSLPTAPRVTVTAPGRRDPQVTTVPRHPGRSAALAS